MNVEPKYRSNAWSLWALLIVVAISVLGGAWWTYRLLNPAEVPEQSGMKVDPNFNGLRAPQTTRKDETEANESLIGEMDELGEPRVRPMTDPADELLNPVRSSEAADVPREDYRLTDKDYVPKAIRAGYLLAPVLPSVEPQSTSIPKKGG